MLVISVASCERRRAESPPRRRRREFSFDSVSHTGVGRVRKNRAGRMFIIWVAGGMFTIGFRGCDFHEKDACGSAGSASLTGSGLSAGSSQKGRRDRGTMTALRQNVSAEKIDLLERSGQVSCSPDPSFSSQTIRGGGGAELESCGSDLLLAEAKAGLIAAYGSPADVGHAPGPH